MPAPKFNVVSKPNDWGKTQKASSGLGKAQKLQGEFWQAFAEHGASDEKYSKEFNKRKALPQHWYDLPMGSSEYHISLTCATQRNEIGIEVYIDNNKKIYDIFYENKDTIEEKTGLKYKWQRLDNKKASRIKAIKKCNVEEQEEWEEAFKWFCENALIIKKNLTKFIINRGSIMKIKCLNCGDIIESKHRHNLVSCKCENCYVDGGQDYLHFGGKDYNKILVIFDDRTEVLASDEKRYKMKYDELEKNKS